MKALALSLFLFLTAAVTPSSGNFNSYLFSANEYPSTSTRSFPTGPCTGNETWIEQIRLTAPDGGLNDNFGSSVVIEGDTAVVGANKDDTIGGTDAGSAYVFTKNAGVWTLQQKLTASDGAGNDFFGTSVAISGDTVAVGAPETGGLPGTVYVFTRSGTVWTQQQKLTKPGLGSGRFGNSVAISGDSLFVGAFADTRAGHSSGEGSVYVYSRSGSVWTMQQQLNAFAESWAGNFGYSVAISGNSLAIGAPLNATGGTNAGAAYVFTQSAGVWTQQQKLVASDPTIGDKFGWSVAINGDAVIAGLGSITGVTTGSAYIFSRSGTVWTEQQKLLADDGSINDQFGQAVALSVNTAFAGAFNDGIPGSGEEGSTYVYTHNGSSWTQRQKLTASDASLNDNFGFSIAVNDDQLIVGAYLDDTSSGGNQGSAYIFNKTCAATPTLTPTGTSTATSTATATDTPTSTPTNAASETPTNTPTDTPPVTPTETPTNTPTATSTPTSTSTNTPSPTCIPTPSNLIAWWRAEGNALDTVADHHGILLGGTDFAAGKVGQGFHFDGVNDNVEVANNITLYPGLLSFTIAVWIQSTPTGDSQVIVSQYECGGECPFTTPDGTTNIDLRIGIDGKLKFYIRDSDEFGGQELVGNTVVDDNNFHFVVAMRDMAANEMRLYVDGNLEGSMILGPGANGPLLSDMDTEPDPFVIGATTINTEPLSTKTRFFSGVIDELLIVHKVLTQTEISDIYNADSAGQCIPMSSPSATPTAMITPVVTGTITYGNAIGAPTPRFVSNVTITASGSSGLMTTTGPPGPTAGQYSLTGFGSGAYTITPTKIGGVNSITSFDSARIAQHVAGTTTLNATQLIVADVSNNGSVSSFDAAQIARYVASTPPYGITGTWKFTPVNRTYSSISGDLTGEDYSALLMGEVSGNWANTGARATNGFDPTLLSWLTGRVY